MAIPILSSIPIVSGILDIINKGIDKLIPDATKRLELKQEMQKYLLELPFEQWKLFEQRVLAEIQHPVWYRDIVRPLITFTSWSLYCYIKYMVVQILHSVYIPIIEAIPKTAENVPQIRALLSEYITSIFTWYDLAIISGILGFWFGPKAFERVVDKLANMKGIKGLFMGGGHVES